MKLKPTCLLLFIFITAVYAQNKDNNQVLTGADILISEHIDMLKGKSLGIISNQTGVLKNGTHIVDTLISFNDINIKALFGTEHGFSGKNADGKKIGDSMDERNIKIYSIYGKNKKPSVKMLEGIDLLIFDIQDIGVRFYTFISSMYYCIESAAENNIPIIILDRPNPIGGINVDGPLVAKDLESFVGIAPIPVMHGMTVGELARLFNEEYISAKGIKAELKIISMKNWKREYYYDETGLDWIPPSPNMPNLETAVVYPGVCFIEGTNISEGRGTDTPFLLFGAPFFNAEEIIAKLNSADIPGASFQKKDFTPIEIPGRALNPKHENEKCSGIKINVTDRKSFQPVRFGVKLLSVIHEIHPGQFKWREYISKLFGRKYLKEMISANKTPDEIISKWQYELDSFKVLRNKYLLY